jgi:hypothetical protein
MGSVGILPNGNIHQWEALAKDIQRHFPGQKLPDCVLNLFFSHDAS